MVVVGLAAVVTAAATWVEAAVEAKVAVALEAVGQVVEPGAVRAPVAAG